ncbi:MAG: DMT family transporter [Planctomycetales bacterium]|nr:DMT family transporter [bacterium]UNM09495.1 MAG: DMT family transporter [Planctomycetales bacterium]
MLKLFTRSPWAELALIYCAAVWGSTFYIVKDSLDNIDPYALVAWRFLAAAALMALPLAARRVNLWTNWKSGALLGLILGVLYVFQTVGLEHTTASNSGFITGLFIVFVPLLNLICFRTLSPWPRLVAVAIAICGLWLLTGGFHEANYGDMLTLVAAVTYAAHVLYADRYTNSGMNVHVLNFQQLLFTGLTALICGVAMGRPFGIGSTETMGWVLFLTLIPTLSAFMLQLTAQQGVPPVTTALVFCLEPVFAAIFAWTLGGEEMVKVRAVGGLLIVLAMVISELPVEKWLARRRPTGSEAAL